jgi:hypothetical protein
MKVVKTIDQRPDTLPIFRSHIECGIRASLPGLSEAVHTQDKEIDIASVVYLAAGAAAI